MGFRKEVLQKAYIFFHFPLTGKKCPGQEEYNNSLDGEATNFRGTGVWGLGGYWLFPCLFLDKNNLKGYAQIVLPMQKKTTTKAWFTQKDCKRLQVIDR